MRFFLLGNHPTLSVAEIAAFADAKADFSLCSKEICILDTRMDAVHVQRLGGVIKSGEIIGETSLQDIEQLAELISNAVLSASGDKRAVFGISVHSLAQGAPIKPAVERAKRLGLTVKKQLAKSGKSARYVASTTPALPSVAILTNGLLNGGGEFVLLVSNSTVYVGQTDVVQDFSAWSKRDYGRPRRDARSGMLPPKLARMMVNLTGSTPASSTILDPFCGSGTVLLEAALIGYDHIIGSDISEKAISDSKINVEWAARSLGIELDRVTIHQGDARTIQERVKVPVDAIATETFLGLPMQKPGQMPTERAREELMHLYRDSFTELHRILKPGSRSVVAFPCWRSTPEHFVHLPLKQELERIGFTVVDPLPKSVPLTLAQRTPSGGLLYARPDAAVGRDILILQRP